MNEMFNLLGRGYKVQLRRTVGVYMVTLKKGHEQLTKHFEMKPGAPNTPEQALDRLLTKMVLEFESKATKNTSLPVRALA